MRKQYYFRPSPAGLLAWDVDRLVELSRELTVRAVPLEEIQELDDALFLERTKRRRGGRSPRTVAWCRRQNCGIPSFAPPTAR